MTSDAVSRLATGLPEPISPRSALRRSIVVWGWGQVSTGDRRGYLLAVIELVWLAGFVLVGLPILSGAGSEAVFVAGAAFAATWVAVAVHAYRRAIDRRERVGLGGADGGAVDLVWLAIPLIIVSTAFWAAAGQQGTPEATLARYEEAWFHQHGTEALSLIRVTANPSPAGGTAEPVTPEDLVAGWGRQSGRLHDELARIVAGLGPGSGIDPDAPLESLRIRVAPDPAGQPGTALGVVTIVRRVSVREFLFGSIPTSAQRLVDVSVVGQVRLRKVDDPAVWPGLVGASRWTIVEIDVLGEHLGGS